MKNVTALYGIIWIVALCLVLGACGSPDVQTVVVSDLRCYFVEFQRPTGDYDMVPIGEVEYITIGTDGKALIWKFNNTGYYGVRITSYGKLSSCETGSV